MTVAESVDTQHVPLIRWTDAEDELLRVEYPTSLDVYGIAQRLGRTLKSVHARARRLGLRKAPGIRAAMAADREERIKAAIAAAPPHPGCMSPEEFHSWRKAGKLTPANPVVGVCEDCTPRYAARMRAEGRCDRPEIRFFQRKALTWARKVNGSTEEGPRVGYAHAPNAGEIYGDLKADSYTYMDVTTGKTHTVRDVEVPVPINGSRHSSAAKA